MSRLLTILFILMSLAVATREIPELTNLADDPSNDGQVFSFQREAEARTINRVEDEAQISARTLAFSPTQNLEKNSVATGRSGQDILRLFGYLRT